jgi:chemotaxis receptor (MCP) glutamine deamidase CheD
MTNMGKSLSVRNSAPALWATSRELVVGRDACRLAIAGERLVTRRVLSDIALAIHIPSAGFAALLRFSTAAYIDTGTTSPGSSSNNPWASADTAIALLLASIASLRLQSKEIFAYAVGAAGESPDAQENQLALHRLLWKEGLPLRGEDLGGNRSRSLWFEAATGRAMVRVDPERGWPQSVKVPGGLKFTGREPTGLKLVGRETDTVRPIAS